MSNFFLFVSIDGITDPLGQSQILPYLIELSKRGHEVGIASIEKNVNFEKNKNTVQELCDQYNISWNYSFYEAKIPIYSQYKNFKNLRSIVENQITNHNENIVLHCRSYLPALIGLHFKKKRKTSFIFDMRGFWADERIEGGIWKLSNPIQKQLYKFFKRKEKELFCNADQIVSLTQKAKSILDGWNWGINPENISVIPCCADLDFFSRKNVQLQRTIELKKVLSISDDVFVLNYNGSLGTWYMIDEMMQFFKELQSVKKSIFLIITKDEPSIAYEAAQKAGIEKNQIIIHSATRSEMPDYIAVSDASLFFIRPTFSKSASSPTKMGELLSMEIPVITNKGVGDVDEIIQDNTCGVLVNGFDRGSYHAAVNELFANYDRYKVNSVFTAQKYFDLKSGAETYNRIYLSFKK